MCHPRAHAHTGTDLDNLRHLAGMATWATCLKTLCRLSENKNITLENIVENTVQINPSPREKVDQYIVIKSSLDFFRIVKLRMFIIYRPYLKTHNACQLFC